MTQEYYQHHPKKASKTTIPKLSARQWDSLYRYREKVLASVPRLESIEMVRAAFSLIRQVDCVLRNAGRRRS